MKHELKCNPEHFQNLVTGVKTFELRFDDRDYRAGDVLHLRETRHTGLEMQNGAPLEYTGREMTFVVTHIITEAPGLTTGFCIMSIVKAAVSTTAAPSGRFDQEALKGLGCTKALKEAGQPYARTCRVCGLGPCRYLNCF